MDLAVEDFTTQPPTRSHLSGHLRRDWPSHRRTIDDRLLYTDGTPMLYSDGTPLRWLGLGFLLAAAPPSISHHTNRPTIEHRTDRPAMAITVRRPIIDLTAGEPTRVTD